MPRETGIGAVVCALGALMLAASYQIPDGKTEALFAGGGGAFLFAGGVYAFLTWVERPKRRPEEKQAADKYSEALRTPPSEEASAYIADRLKKDDNDEG